MSDSAALVTKYVLGAWDLAVSVDLLLQGALFAQFAHYVTLYKKDTVLLRCFVYGLLLLTTLKTVQTITVMWMQNVDHFGDPFDAADLFFTSWIFQLNLCFSAIIAFYVQMFYCHRFWVISRTLHVVGLMLVLFVFALVASFVATAYGFKVNAVIQGRWIAGHLATVLAGDVVLCASTAYSLIKTTRQVLPETAGMLSAVLRLTIQSAVPAVICALTNLIASQSGDHTQTANLSSMLAIICNNALPKLYALSALYTLNSRHNIRLARSHGQTTSSSDGGRRRGPHGQHNNIELGGLSAHNRTIEVHTQVQTIQHGDEAIAVFARGKPGIAMVMEDRSENDGTSLKDSE